jgi:hypothetical protein
MKTRGRKPTLRDMPAVLALFSNQELATALGLKYATAAAMKQRGWVDSAYWVRLVTAVHERGLVLTYEMLCQWAARARGRTPRAKSSRSRVRRRPTRRSSSTAAIGPPP